MAALVVAAIAFFVVLASGGQDDKGESLTPETVQAGQCVDVTETAGEQIDITAADCSRGHDAEVVLTTQVGEAIDADVGLDDAEMACTALMDDADVATLAERDGLEWGLLIDEPSNIDSFDRLVCYVRDPGGQLEEKLLD